MLPSANAYSLIKQFERFRPTAYLPTPHDVWTLGWGHTYEVHEGETCTQAQAEDWLHNDVQWASNAVNENVTANLTQNQFDALVSFVFNIGSGGFAESTLLRKLNDRDYAGAAAEFTRWNKQRGRVLDGLVARRAAEQALFES